MKEKVNIVTPSYNQGQFLQYSIESVLEQDYSNIEYIIMDGLSEDNTLDILKKYKKHIYWRCEKDRGQADAMNKGFSIANGDIFTWLNSDDLLASSDVVSSVVEFFALNPDVDIVYGDLIIINENGEIYFKKKEIEFDKKISLYGDVPICPAAFFRRKVWEKIGPFAIDLKWAMDQEYWLRAMKAGFNFRLIRKPLFKYRWHNNAKTASQYSKLQNELRDVRRKYSDFKFLNNYSVTAHDRLLDFLHIVYKIKWLIVKYIQRRQLHNPFWVKRMLHKAKYKSIKI